MKTSVNVVGSPVAMVVATALGRWIEREGGLVGPIQISSRGGLRGLFVSEAVKAGTPLLAVPRHCTLHSDAVADDDASALRPHRPVRGCCGHDCAMPSQS